MIFRRRSLALLALVALASAADAHGAPEVLHLDPQKSRITFILDATMHKVEGTARLTQGTIRFDLATGEAGGEVLADARSAETGNGKRDRTMHGDVLESAAHTQIAFYPEHIEGTLTEGAERVIRIRGTFLLHGDKHPLTLSVRVRKDAAGLTGTASFAVPYVAWGLKDPSVFVLRVGKEVEVTLQFAGALEQSVPAAAPTVGQIPGGRR